MGLGEGEVRLRRAQVRQVDESEEEDASPVGAEKTRDGVLRSAS